MDNRIKIGDVWYVKESEVEVKEDFEITYSKEMQIETEGFLLVGSILRHEGEWSIVSLEERGKDGVMIECMDNELWLLGIANRDPKSMKELYGDEEFRRATIQLCDKMKELEWVKD